MNKILNIIRRHNILSLFIFSLVMIVAAFMLDVGLTDEASDLHITSVALVLLLSGIAALSFAAWEVIRFHRALRNLLRRIISGDYEVGLTMPAFYQTDLTILKELVNKMVEQLRVYDELRKRRIRQLRMTLSLVQENAAEPIILFDAEKGALECNGASKNLLHTARQTAQISVLEKNTSNSPFIELLNGATQKEKSTMEGTVSIQFSDVEEPVEIHVRIVPYKDKDDTVPFAIIYPE